MEQMRESVIKVKAKSGKIYNYKRFSPIKEINGERRISRTGRPYISYYKARVEKRARLAQRDAEIIRRVKSGETCEGVGNDYNLTKQRISQIVNSKE